MQDQSRRCSKTGYPQSLPLKISNCNSATLVLQIELASAALTDSVWIPLVLLGVKSAASFVGGLDTVAVNLECCLVRRLLGNL